MGRNPRGQTRPGRPAHLTIGAVLAPGYGGNAQQQIVQAMARLLAHEGVVARPVSFTRARPTGDFGPELDDLRRARDELHTDRLAFVGRSFGGRMCARLADVEPPDALVVLGHPIAPRNRPRPDDEAALARVTCPTLVVQGEHDPLGPVEVLRAIARENSRIQLYVLAGVGHQFGKRQSEGLAYAAEWLIHTLQGSPSG